MELWSFFDLVLKEFQFIIKKDREIKTIFTKNEMNLFMLMIWNYIKKNELVILK